MAPDAPRGTGGRADRILGVSMPGPVDGVDLREIFGILRRRRSVILGCMALLTALTALMVMQLTPRYSAEASVILDARKTQAIDIQLVLSGLPIDEAVVKSEMDILKSPTIVEKVAARLNLIAVPEFNRALKPSVWAEYNPLHWVQALFLSIGLVPAPPVVSPEMQREITLSGTAQTLLDRTSIVNDVRSYLIKIRVESQDRKLAADLANAYVDVYLQEQLEAKLDATKRANTWLNSRIADLRQKAADTDRAVQLFKQQHQLTEVTSRNQGGSTVVGQQLSELNSQMILASADRAQKEASLRQVQDVLKSSGGAEAAAQVLAAPLIQNLRQQEAEVIRKEAELATRYRPAHPEMVNVHAEIRDLRSKIALEVNRIVQGMANDVTTARARETSLRDSIQGLQNSVAKQDEASVQLRELQREADTSRTLYENFLTRFKQTSEQQDIQQSDSRPVAVAKIPIGASYPKTALIVSFAFFASGIVGVLVALIIERLDNGFRSADQIQSIAGVASLGLVPAARAGVPIDIPIVRPTSAYAESIRAVRTSLRYSNIDTPPRVILVTSSLPKEGKTTFSISLARSIAASGARVLLIDCDLRRPAVNAALGGAETSNLLELFSEGKPGHLLTTRDEKSGLDYIPVRTGTPNPQDLLSSQQMRSFLDEMRRQYDYIVLDAPPVLAVSDPLILAHIVDTTIFLVRWERTPRAVSLGALRLLQNNGGKLAGIVLSRVNVRKHAQYGYGDSGYYYGHYATYYGKS